MDRPTEEEPMMETLEAVLEVKEDEKRHNSPATSDQKKPKNPLKSIIP